jgi:hypothetical protein
MTLYTFRNPHHGSKLRVCQALISPNYQGRGLGLELLLLLYRDIVRVRGDVSEMTVEDPCVGFQRLRDKADYAWYNSEYKSATNGNVDGEEQLVSRCLKIKKSQAVFVLEAKQYLTLLDAYKTKHADNLSGFEDSPEFKTFRLSVKRRMTRTDPELKSMSKQDMQAELTELFNAEVQRYRRVTVKKCER